MGISSKILRLFVVSIFLCLPLLQVQGTIESTTPDDELLVTTDGKFSFTLSVLLLF